jgi:thiol-disulfide isomerase/thioredoxin
MMRRTINSNPINTEDAERTINTNTKTNRKRINTTVTAVLTVLCMVPMGTSAVFAKGTADSVTKAGKTTEESSTESESDSQVIMMEDGQVISMEDGEISSDLISGTFKPSDVAWEVQDSYEFPFLGMNLTLPEELLKQMEQKNVAMLSTEDWNEDSTQWKYGYLSWSTMTKEQREAEVDKMGTGYDEWVASLGKIGTIGAYDEESAKNLDEITGCTEHTKLGESGDGAYTYYLSVNKDADEELVKEVEAIKTEFTDMAEFQQISVFDQPQKERAENTSSLGSFEMTGIDGKTYTEDVFRDYDLTLVNVFTTWCSPCVKEIPELEKLYQELKDSGVGVVGVVLDTVDADGNQDEDTVKKAEILQQKTGVSYPFLIPDEGMMNSRLNGINAFPETFFVDKNGNIVGETYSGSRDLESWKEIVEKTRAQMETEDSTQESEQESTEE